MVLRLHLYILAILLFCIEKVHSQNQDNRRSKTISVKDCTIEVDGAYVLPGSVVVKNTETKQLPIDFKIVSFEPFVIELTDCNAWKNRTISITYRKLDLPTSLEFKVIDSLHTTTKPGETYIAYDLRKNEFLNKDPGLFGNGLDYTGSFTRGFALGNAQSLTLDSRFDLQLNGEIGNGIKIQAAITDDNIPIQPEGNTQVLQEFDRIYIALQKDRTQVQAGDYVIQRPQSWFINYFKKIKGLGVQTEQNFGKAGHRSEVNIASSRGKFARQTLVIAEGNQGPYKLTGNNNERFLIVLSGTEKIYFNGELLTRGQDHDYIIDYNLAQITFSPTRLVARESRIIVEYEYTDQNYYRTLYAANSYWNIKNSHVKFFFYSEQDSKKTTSQIELDSASIETLEVGGDNADRYNVSQLQLADPNDATSVTYRIVNNPNFPSDPNPTILEYSIDPNELLYTSSFTEVGSGKGSYVIDTDVGANGRVYKFVGMGKGNYDAVRRLVAPEKKQMMGLAYSTALGKKHSTGIELTLSQLDKNLFSPIDDGDNTGWAGYMFLKGQKFLRGKTDSLNLGYEISHEHTNSSFRPLNQYRQAEFFRDWNYTPIVSQREDIFRAGINLLHKNNNRVVLGFQRLETGGGFVGNQYKSDFYLKYKRLQISGKPSVTQTLSSTSQAAFVRPNFRIIQGLPFLNAVNIGIDYEGENNLIDSLATSTISSHSFAFNHLKTFLEWSIGGGNQIKFSYNKRTDKLAGKTDLEKITNITEYESWLGLNASKYFNLNASLKVRDFKALNPVLRPQDKSKLSTLGNIDINAKILKNVITLASNYQVSSGQEPKLEYVYQKVENLRGEYVYVGPDTAKVKNINDFRYDPGNPLAEYTRFVVPNNEFTTTNNTAIQSSVRFDPVRWWSQGAIPREKWKKLLSKFSALNTLRLQGKTLSSVQSYSPFSLSTADSSLVNYQNNTITAFNFNKGNPNYDLSYTIRRSDTKSNQVNGFEARNVNEDESRARVKIFRNTDIILLYTQGVKVFDNRLFADRNYLIEFTRIEAELNLRPSTQFRYSLRYKQSRLAQQINQLENARKKEYNTECNYRHSGNTSLDLSFSFVDVQYNGAKGSFVEYDLLEGLKGGKNFLWSLGFTKRVSKVIDLILSYEGRKTGSNDALHVARMQAKATF